MYYFDISDNGIRGEKRYFSNSRLSNGDKYQHCNLWYYKGTDIDLLGGFTVPVNTRSVAHKLPNLKVHEMLEVSEKGYLILSDTETIQIEPV